MSLLECLARFQTGIVGVIGFTGVIITLLSNAWLARVQRNETRLHEQKSLAAALQSELTITRDSLREDIPLIDAAVKDGSPSVLVTKDTNSEVYEALLGKIGGLPADVVRQTMIAYLTIRSMRKKVRLLPGATERDDQSVSVPRESFEYLKKMYSNHLPPVEAALKALEGLK